MSNRTRHYVLLAVTVVLGAVYARAAGDWTDVQFYGGAAGLIALIVLVGLPWTEFAPDGAFRSQRQA
jgi:hypothetical protein